MCIVHNSHINTLHRDFNLSGWKTLVLELCKHVTTHFVDNNIPVNFCQEYVNI